MNKRNILKGLAQALVILSVLAFPACQAPLGTMSSNTSIERAARGAWAPNVAYTTGDTVTYNGTTYTCVQSHTSLTGWEPPNVPALWSSGGSSGGGTVATPTPPPSGSTGSGIANGTYEISSKRDSSKAVADPAYDMNNGVKIIVWVYGGGNDQKWTVTANGNGYYRIINVNSGLALDNPSGSTTQGTVLQQWSWSSGNYNQEWAINNLGNGSYSVINRASGQAMNLLGGNTTDGTQVIQWPFSSSDQNSAWIFTSVSANSGGGNNGSSVGRPGECPADQWSYMVSATNVLGMPADFAWLLSAMDKQESSFGAGLAGSPSAGDGLLQVQPATRSAYASMFSSTFGHAYNDSASDQIALGALIAKDMINNYAGGSWRIGITKYNGGPYYVPGSVDAYGRPIYADQYAATVMATYNGYGGTHQ